MEKIFLKIYENFSPNVTELRSGCSRLKKRCLRGSCWEKGKLLLIRMPATWGDGGLGVPKIPTPKILLSHENFQGKKVSNLS